MYRIEKVLNNNSILASKDNQEVIFLGKGIGFGKKINDIYIPGDGVKKYKMETKEQEKGCHTRLSGMLIPFLLKSHPI